MSTCNCGESQVHWFNEQCDIMLYQVFTGLASSKSISLLTIILKCFVFKNIPSFATEKSFEQLAGNDGGAELRQFLKDRLCYIQCYDNISVNLRANAAFKTLYRRVIRD